MCSAASNGSSPFATLSRCMASKTALAMGFAVGASRWAARKISLRMECGTTALTWIGAPTIDRSWCRHSVSACTANLLTM
ncbi:Uncharacterised protein [Mycobacteroides abscessus subsp. abscessus]|nr:Uncharacterised protein [Mycobacteroides abscessus subsp. abscessus]